MTAEQTPGQMSLNLRKFDPAVRDRARNLSGARGLPMSEYFAALVALHEAMLERATTGDKSAAARLREVGLEPVIR